MWNAYRTKVVDAGQVQKEMMGRKIEGNECGDKVAKTEYKKMP